MRCRPSQARIHKFVEHPLSNVSVGVSTLNTFTSLHVDEEIDQLHR